MPGVAHAGGIRDVITGPGVARTFAFALIGRLAYGLLPLCMLFTVRNSSGSFAVAAATSAALAAATMAMPFQARLIDRYGQPRVLPWYATCYSTLLITAGAMSDEAHADAVWVTAGLLLGLSAPALGPSMRAQWREIAPEGPRRRVAYSIDSIAEESLYLIGPLAAGLLLAAGPARIGLFLSAGLIAIGTTGLVTSRYVPACASSVPTGRVSDAGPSVLRRSGVAALLLIISMIGAAGAACFVGVAAIADTTGVPGAVGLIEAGMATGAIVAGVAWARLSKSPAWPIALGLLLLASGLAQAGAVAATPHLALVGVTLVAVGAAAAPILVVAFTGADNLVAPEQRTEASTWVSTALNGGNALGTAFAGLIITLSLAAPFALATCLTTLASATAFALATRARQAPPTT